MIDKTDIVDKLERRLSSAAALEVLDGLAAIDYRVLGADGFDVCPEGHVAKLDLIIDVSKYFNNFTVDEQILIVRMFIENRSSSDRLWEIVATPQIEAGKQ